MPETRSYTIQEIQDLLANLDSFIPESEPVNKKMKRVKLPIPPEYGGGVVTGNRYLEAVRNLITRLGEKIVPASTAPTFKESWESWMAIKNGQNKSPSTIQGYTWIAEHYLLPYFGEKPIDQITPDDIQLYFNTVLLRSRSISIQSRAILCGILNRASRLGQISDNPMRFKYELSRKKSDKVVLQDDDLLNVIEHLEDLHQTGYQKDYLYFCFLCFTALRRGEILGLRWKDIDFDANEITVRNNVTFPNGTNTPVVREPKDGSYGVVHLQSGLAQRIKKYQADPDDYIFSYSSNKPNFPFTRSMFNKLWGRCSNILDLKGATSHSFRASYATMMNTHCDHMDAKTLQNALRHKTPGLALEIYTKPNTNKTRLAEQEYDAWLQSQLV